ncbi:stalk domain-containing protein [Paenibacillus sp. CAU 1782]
MKKSVIIVGISAAMLLSMGTGAFAATKLQEIKAFLNPDIKVKVDGSPIQLKDANGNAIVPINYKDSNYFPIRAISDALGVAVDYDNETKTIILGEKIDGTAIAQGFDDMYHTKDPAQTTYKGIDYKEAYFNNGNGNRNGSFMLYPKKEHQKLYLQIAAIGEDIEKVEIKDSDNDIILKQVNVVKAEDGLVTIEADIGGVESLYIHFDIKENSAAFIPLNASYYR